MFKDKRIDLHFLSDIISIEIIFILKILYLDKDVNNLGLIFVPNNFYRILRLNMIITMKVRNGKIFD